ncbi:MAG: nucleotidyltransferase domain-containing protein [Desulfurococcaceae archaeon]
MAREDFVEYLYHKYLARKKCLENIATYISRIKEACLSIDPYCRIILFGSYVRGEMRPDSDIDVLLVTEHARDPWMRAKLYKKIFEDLGVERVFQVHIVTQEEYEKWYKKFIDVYVEV